MKPAAGTIASGASLTELRNSLNAKGDTPRPHDPGIDALTANLSPDTTIELHFYST